MTPFVWMFIKTYEKLREFIINNKNISSLIQMEYSAFEEATVPICTFVLKNSKDSEKGIYIKLSDFKGGMEVQRQKVLEAIKDKACGYKFHANVENFAKIPGLPIAYWVKPSVIENYKIGKELGLIAYPKTGMTTGDNSRFLRLWSEVNIGSCKFDCENKMQALESGLKWFPYCKGGGFRKWYGFNEFVVNWENDGYEIKNNIKTNGLKAASVRSENLYFKKLITWSAVTSGKFSCRYVEKGFLFDSGGSSISVNVHDKYILALLNSVVGQFYLDISNATINYQPGDIARIPVIFSDEYRFQIDNLVNDNLDISKLEWDSFETSWNFTLHPLVRFRAENGRMQDAYIKMEHFYTKMFDSVKENEEELNRIFINIYSLHDELTPEVDDKDVTIRKADLKRDIRSFISYAVGCIFGRYSLDVEGLAYAGGEWDASKYKTFIPDADNIIPITDEEIFEDDIVVRFVEFVKTVYGEETLEENLDFIAAALGNKGNTSREIIRNYFLKDFYPDHAKVYQRRPIYWMFDSGKENGFKALIYLHRYNEDTVGRVRTDYLHKVQTAIENAIDRCDIVTESDASLSDKAKAVKRKEKLVKQLAETRLYDQAIAHIALKRIPLDLDDGVVVNYAKFQGIEVATEGKKPVKINLLGAI